MIIVDNIEQGTPEWFQLRCGVPSASNFKKIITTKGVLSKSADRYMFDLAMERKRGFKKLTYKSKAMDEGTRREPESRKCYEFLKGVDVTEVALCYKDKKKRYSCSPDGLIVPDEHGLELKNVEDHTHYFTYMADPNQLVKDYFQQVQGSLFITGYKAWDIMSYVPDLEPVIVRVLPDLKFHKALKPILETFCNELDKLSEKLNAS